MESPTTFKMPPLPTSVTPLNPVSQDRINQQRIPASASLPNHLSESKHAHRPSDVQSKVAFLNSLNGVTRTSINPANNGISSPVETKQYGSSTTAALQRAILGREEAESALSSLQAQILDAVYRERKISERVESLMEELQATRERQAHERQIYEKEIKRARKDAFRAGSGLVKVQEDLKEARAENRSLRTSEQKERFDKEKAKQEAFERAYTLAGLTEELQNLKEKVMSLESEKATEELLENQRTMIERETSMIPSSPMASVKAFDESDAQLASGIDVAEQEEMADQVEELQPRRNRFERLLPVHKDEVIEIAKFGGDMRRRRTTLFETRLEGADDEDSEEQIDNLKGELRWERTLRERADEMIHFLNMECQFNMCSCRRAEMEGKRFIHDWEWERKLRAESAERKREAACENPEAINTPLPIESKESIEETEDVHDEIEESHTPLASPTSGSFDAHMQRTMKEEQPHSAENEDDQERHIPYTDDQLFDLGPHELTVQSPAAHEDFSPVRAVPRSPSTDHVSAPFRPSTPSAVPESSVAEVTTNQSRYYRSSITRSHLHTETTTVMIPLRNDDDSNIATPPHLPHTTSNTPNVKGLLSTPSGSPGPMLPGTPISREAALAQIRARRDRARSVNLKNGSNKGESGRGISAPGSARRGLRGGIVTGGRDFSGSSAPGRI